MRTSVFLSASFCVALAACSGTTTNSPPSLPASANAGPGPTIVDPVMASDLFKRVCVDSGAKHMGMETELSKLPVIRDSQSDVIYHKKFNLSFKMQNVDGKQACSLVAKSNDPSSLAIMLAATGTDSVPVSSNVFGGYVKALAEPKS